MKPSQKVQELQQCIRDAQNRLVDMGRIIGSVKQAQGQGLPQQADELDRLCRDAGQKLQQAQMACEQVF